MRYNRQIVSYSPMSEREHRTYSQDVLPLVTAAAVVDVVNLAKGPLLAMSSSDAPRLSTRPGAA